MAVKPRAHPNSRARLDPSALPARRAKLRATGEYGVIEGEVEAVGGGFRGRLSWRGGLESLRVRAVRLEVCAETEAGNKACTTLAECREPGEAAGSTKTLPERVLVIAHVARVFGGLALSGWELPRELHELFYVGRGRLRAREG